VPWLPSKAPLAAILYLEIGIPFLLIGLLLSPNANSLHQLYRDRLAKAFLFDPTQRVADAEADPLLKVTRRWFGFRKEVTGPEADLRLHRGDLKPLNELLVSSLGAPPLQDRLALADRTHRGPYHLINTSLNIEASKFANRRGRNADFFLFSRLFTGSEATGYVNTERMEQEMPGLTAGAAMAISGAAVSPNMGSATVKPLVPTLAILNIRLGYWLTNPRKLVGKLKKRKLRRFFEKWLFHKPYFLIELLGLLSEASDTVYLTDGGNLENLSVSMSFCAGAAN
jgi:hypothetical protein